MTVSGVKGWAVRRWSTAFAVPAPLEVEDDCVEAVTAAVPVTLIGSW